MGQHQSLADSTLTSLDIGAIITSSAANGAVLDMQGWDGVMYVFNLGAMVTNATFDARVMSSANSNFSGNANITNAALTQVLAASGNTALYIIDVYRPTQRFLKTITTAATANVTFSSTAHRYRRSGILPPTQVAVQVVKVAVN